MPFAQHRSEPHTTVPVPLVLALAAVVSSGLALSGTTVRAPLPSGTLVAAPELRLPSPHASADMPADSNSPAVWSLVRGAPVLQVLTSIDGYPSRTTGNSLEALSPAAPVGWRGAAPPDGVWMEAVVTDAGGVWYGYYHNEVAPPGCPGSTKIEPRIGAARSYDRGRSWRDLGIVLAAPPGTADCASRNRYFVGGVGDFSVVLDADQRFLYLFYSQYLAAPGGQGVAVARMAWADRDAPAGKVDVWQGGAWLPPTPAPAGDAGDGQETARPTWVHQAASPILTATDSWHDGTTANAFWGPSVHWNTYLQQYVMLLNRTRTVNWDQEGIYSLMNSRIDTPTSWSVPRRLLAGGDWYPQVMGLEPGTGTDKLAGRVARFYMGGKSVHLIDFSRN